MKVYHGKSVFGGIAIGKTAVYQKSEQQVKRVKTEDSDGEWARYQAAREASIEQLGELYDKACREVGETNAAIFEIHQMMLEDDDYNESVENIIRTQQVNAEYAVAATGDNFSQMFAAMDDDYMRGRAADVKDISERVLNNLSGAGKTGLTTDEPVIILADDLAPSETVQLDKDKVLSFVTVHGSTNSHTAILARTMAIPALIGTDIPLDETTDGVPAVVDGSDGTIYVDPDEETMALMQEKKRADEEKKALLQQLKGKENKTIDGKKIMLYANIGNIKDLAADTAQSCAQNFDRGNLLNKFSVDHFMQDILDACNVHHLKLGDQFFVQLHELGTDHRVRGAAQVIVVENLTVATQKVIVPKCVLCGEKCIGQLT